MIKLENLQKILKLVLLTGNLKNHKPVSLLIVGKSGNGKTELIKSFKKKSLAIFTDLTYTGLLDALKKDTRIKHVLIPDFIKITQKKRSTSDNFVSLLNAMTEEGIGKVKLWNNDEDFKDKQIGLITATTKASFGQNKERWASFGFIQRMLIVSYDYSNETIEEIIDFIVKEEYLNDKKTKIKETGKKVESSEKLNRQLIKIADNNFRNLKTLQSLAKANAITRKDNKVNQEDINEIIRLSKYMNLNYTKI